MNTIQRIMITAAAGLALMSATGCRKMQDALFPDSSRTEADLSAICRATPGHQTGKIESDTQWIFTGWTSGEEGVIERIDVCKNDPRCEASWQFCGDTSTCKLYAGTAVGSDGLIVEFRENGIHLTGGVGLGYKIFRITTDYSCHG